jgi:hypothetical protein
MGNRHRDRGKLPPFVPLFRHTIKSPAWKAASVGARATFFELKANYNTKAQNAVYLATRTGRKQLNASKNSVTRWLRELEFYGFIVKVQGAHLGLKGIGKAALYRLTDCHYAGEPPTYDFQNWTGKLFEPAKHMMSRADKERLKRRRPKQNPVPPVRTPRPNGRDEQRVVQMALNTRDRPNGRDKGNDLQCPNGRDITSFTSCGPELRLSGLMEWTTPTLVEIAYTEELRRLYRCEVLQEAA